MAPKNDQTDDNDPVDTDGTGKGEAEQPPADTGADDAGQDEGGSATDDRDWKAEAERWKTLSRKNEKSFKDSAAKLKQYEDANKSESQRLQEERDTHKTRAERAEAALKRREIAEHLAPDHATAKQIAQVAKRMSGDDEDALEADARELFEWIAPAPEAKAAPKTPSRPKERLKGGSEPDEEPDETDPRKLAAMVPRRR